MLFYDTILRLFETQEQGTIYTPFGFATGIVTAVTEDQFNFKSNDGQRFTLYIEDLMMVKEL